MGYQLTGMYIGNTKLRPSGGSGRPLGANTIAYYPLNGDILDHKGDYGISGTTYDLSAKFGTPSYSTSFDTSKVAFNPQATGSQSGGCGLINNNSIWNFSGDFTISFCVRVDQHFSDYMSFITNRSSGGTFRWMNSIDGSRKFFFHGSAQYLTNTALTIGTWYNITCAVVSGTYTIYINGTSVKTGTYSYSSSTPSVLNVGVGYYSGGSGVERFNGCISEIIIDGEGWDATKALDRATYLGFA